jgi:preprotein translocase subunit SecF
MRILTNVKIDWLRWRWHTLALSWLIILGGVGMMIVRGVPLGIDFAGGTNVIVRFEKPVSDDAVRGALSSIPGDVQIQQFGNPGDNEKLIKLPQATTQAGAAVDQTASHVVELLQKANVGKVDVLQTEYVGPVIGQDLQRKGIYATIGSLLGIMAYIAFRFRLSFGIGAMTASVHDVLITLSIMTFVGYELSLNVIAAILTLVGYGVNDQIVIFDRVRENLRSHRREPMRDIINLSVNQTLPRTVITAGTVVLAVLSLYLFGGEVLKPFAFAMLVGTITSTYSTVFIASAVAVLLSPKPRTAAATASSGDVGTTQGGKKQKRAKAS